MQYNLVLIVKIVLKNEVICCSCCFYHILEYEYLLRHVACLGYKNRIILSIENEFVVGGGGVVPMIRSAVRTTLRSLLRSDLVAELNQTVIDVQRTDSMMVE